MACFSLTFLLRAFSNVSSNVLPEKRQSHIGCICLIFLHYASSNVSSNCLPEMMHNHTGCICLTFLHCDFSNVSSNGLHERMHSHNGRTLSFSHCVFSCATSTWVKFCINIYIPYTSMEAAHYRMNLCLWLSFVFVFQICCNAVSPCETWDQSGE